MFGSYLNVFSIRQLISKSFCCFLVLFHFTAKQRTVLLHSVHLCCTVCIPHVHESTEQFTTRTNDAINHVLMYSIYSLFTNDVRRCYVCEWDLNVNVYANNCFRVKQNITYKIFPQCSKYLHNNYFAIAIIVAFSVINTLL